MTFIVTEVSVKFTRRLRGHFVTLNGVSMHLLHAILDISCSVPLLNQSINQTLFKQSNT